MARDFLHGRFAERSPGSDPGPSGDGRARGGRRWIVVLYVAFGVQALSALFFVADLWTEVLGLRSTPLPWVWQEYIQTFASLGLVVGVFVSGTFLRRSLARLAALNRQVDVAAGNFQHHLLQLFAEWNLSASEQSVAIYAMKGFSNAEIAELRNTTASTVKSQLNSIYRKCGLGNRQQLISLLVEELLSGVAVNGGAKPDGAAPEPGGHAAAGQGSGATA